MLTCYRSRQDILRDIPASPTQHLDYKTQPITADPELDPRKLGYVGGLDHLSLGLPLVQVSGFPISSIAS